MLYTRLMIRTFSCIQLNYIFIQVCKLDIHIQILCNIYTSMFDHEYLPSIE